jgi:hypothetical protein
VHLTSVVEVCRRQRWKGRAGMRRRGGGEEYAGESGGGRGREEALRGGEELHSLTCPAVHALTEGQVPDASLLLVHLFVLLVLPLFVGCLGWLL